MELKKKRKKLSSKVQSICLGGQNYQWTHSKSTHVNLSEGKLF